LAEGLRNVAVQLEELGEAAGPPAGSDEVGEETLDESLMASIEA
jgi:hypothetical protein